MEKDKTSQTETAKIFQLQLEELDDRSRRNNVRLRGLSENVDQGSLSDKVRGIFHVLLGDVASVTMELDRVHRALGSKSTNPNRPRDVICRLHYFSQKEIILRTAWEVGTIELDDIHVKILPDLSKATLQT